MAECAALHAVAATYQLHQIYTGHDILIGWYEPFNYRWNAATALFGFALAYTEDSPLISTACEALARSIDVLERTGSFFGVAASAAMVIKKLFRKVDTLMRELETAQNGTGQASKGYFEGIPENSNPLSRPSWGVASSLVFPEALGTMGPSSEFEPFGFNYEMDSFTGMNGPILNGMADSDPCTGLHY
ncbi:hypothetical protein FZEAL_9787 [Fusarium zealandicum]|uniref:Uncharacterized protein n=1 Tax=Fusarium zealandicum TaxID=1053134 RepID=A0A8H4U8R6_9HYPO|nr:hypothetical protein FZEAL_9787 [Fusarium zealandicum]